MHVSVETMIPGERNTKGKATVEEREGAEEHIIFDTTEYSSLFFPLRYVVEYTLRETNFYSNFGF